MDSLRLALDLCREVSDKLDTIGEYTPTDGMNALAWSDAETQSIALIASEMQKLGADPIQDRAGNLTGLKQGTFRHDVKGAMVGSHLDAVTKGGRYDGRAGVLVALACLKMLHEEQRMLPHDFMLQIFRGEESSRFGKALLGSAMATGQSSLADFKRVSTIKGEDVTLEQAMQSQGFYLDALMDAKNSLRPFIEEGTPLIPTDHIGWYVEPHIEQAGLLRSEGIHVGLATGIFGNTRIDVRLLGEAGHTGSTPMNLRVDAEDGMSQLRHYFRSLQADAFCSGDNDAVFTVPRFEVLEANNTTIPHDVAARFEVRSIRENTLEMVRTKLQEELNDIVSEGGYVLHEDTRFNNISRPTPGLSVNGIGRLESAAEASGILTMQMSSGAGHDVQNMNRAGIESSLLFIAHGAESTADERGGYSHIPHEDMVVEVGADPYAEDSPFASAVRTVYEAVTKYDAPVKEQDEASPALWN